MGFQDLPSLRRRYAGQAGQLINDFYVPVLGRATRYDRQAGYFDSASLVQIAAGLAAFLRRLPAGAPPGRAPMRLITGASWQPDDVRAFERGQEALSASLGASLAQRLEPDDAECELLGLPPGWLPEADQIARHRLGALAWMIARRLLDVRIALPLDSDGRPYLPGRGGALYHPKAGLLYNGHGDVIFFQGSVNETGAAWTRNREKFEVKRSWFSVQDRDDIQAEQEEFEALWEGRDPGLLVLPLPDAARRGLLKFEPPEPPQHDIMEVGQPFGPARLADRAAAQFLLDAPRLAGGEALVLQPLSLSPFPHQARIVQRAAGQFPRRFLFCDEVGLGKTIEAGLALRTLLLRGTVRRVLLITPRGLVRQWQEELREKFALTAWHYDGRRLVDVGGRVRATRQPWDEPDLVIVSRQYVARRARLPEFLDVRQPWDLVIVDEAHAARRQRFNENQPNIFLDLLRGLSARQRFNGLWLLTATPMQLDPLEVHDLLMLCGLNSPAWDGWRESERFVQFFDDLRHFGTNPDQRRAVLEMAGLAVQHGAPALPLDSAPLAWQPFPWQALVRQINERRPGLHLAMRNLTQAQAEAMTPYLARQTPLGVHMFRYTRTTLRAYQERGRLPGSVPVRDPRDVPVQLQTTRERELYQRIDVLCSEFYKLEELPPGERQGIGFLRAVFRKRLASSFAAFRLSLQRRRDLIEQAEQAELDAELRRGLATEVEEEDDPEDDGPPDDFVEQERERLRTLSRARRESERRYLQQYLNDLNSLPGDSKFDTFRAQIDALLAEGHRVIVFTQYLDTLDFIRRELITRLGHHLICYSGRGGEVWDPAANHWRPVDKAVIKARSDANHPTAAQVLLATDAASEGINLQQFSAVINYDLPWNPMRVEQRIGRIDRIGQDRPVVAVVNLYLEDSIEQDAYFILRQRIGFFEEVVGPLQPILAEMPRLLRMVAQGEMERAEALAEMETLARSQASVPLQNLSEYVGDDDSAASYLPTDSRLVTQAELAAWCLAHLPAGMSLEPAPEPSDDAASAAGTCYFLNWPEAPAFLGIELGETITITFDPAVADRHPPTGPQEDDFGQAQSGTEGVRLFTWGEPLLTAWLTAVQGERLTAAELDQLGLRHESDRYLRADDGRPIAFRNLLGD